MLINKSNRHRKECKCATCISLDGNLVNAFVAYSCHHILKSYWDEFPRQIRLDMKKGMFHIIDPFYMSSLIFKDQYNTVIGKDEPCEMFVVDAPKPTVLLYPKKIKNCRNCSQAKKD